MKERFVLNCMTFHKGQYYFSSNDKFTLPDEVLRTITSSPEMYFPLPTEVVVRKAQIVTPMMGRVWCHKHLGMFPNADGNGQHSEHTYLLEVWVGNGDDGHVSYALAGYAEVIEQDARDYVREMEEGGERYYVPQIMDGAEWIA